MSGTSSPTTRITTGSRAEAVGDRLDFVVMLRSLTEFTQLYSQSASKRDFEEVLARGAQGLETWTLPAWCRVCNRGSLLHVDLQFSDGITPNFWECLVCPSCGLSCRRRFIAEQLLAVVDADTDGAGRARTVRIDGHPGALGRWAATAADSRPGLKILENRGTGTGHAPTIGIFSIDVLPSAVDLDFSLREAVEDLSPGGRLVLSVPFHAEARETVSPAPTTDPPTGHQLGWDVLDRCLAAGFDDAYAMVHWSAAFGYLGNGAPLLLVAEKAAS